MGSAHQKIKDWDWVPPKVTLVLGKSMTLQTKKKERKRRWGAVHVVAPVRPKAVVLTLDFGDSLVTVKAAKLCKIDE